MPRRKQTAEPITDGSPIQMPLAIFLACLTTVAGAVYGFQGAITAAVRDHMSAYLTRAEFYQRLDQEDRQQDTHFLVIRHELQKLEAKLK